MRKLSGQADTPVRLRYRIELKIVERGFFGEVDRDQIETAQINIETDDQQIKKEILSFILKKQQEAISRI